MDGGLAEQNAVELPEGWRKAKIAQLASIITGPFGTLLKASEYGGADGVPLISVGEIREGYLRVTDETPTVGEVVTKRLPQYLLREGDIVFGRKGGVERSAFINRHQAGWFLGSDGISIRLKAGVHSPFFGHAFRSGAVQTWLLQNASGTTMPSLNQAILGAVEIPFPDEPEEQKAIAEALSDADALIEGLERLIAKKQFIKQGAMQDLLTAKRRLPGFSGEWAENTVQDVAIVDPEALGAGTPKDRNIKYISLEDVNRGVLNSWSETTFGEAPSRARRILRSNDVLLGTVRPNLQSHHLFLRQGDGWIGSTGFAVLRARPELCSAGYLFELIMSNVIGRQIDELIAGSNYPAISNRDVRKLAILLPPLEEQNAISAILGDMNAEIQAFETRLEKARQLKEGMMQNLLTGRIRLV